MRGKWVLLAVSSVLIAVAAGALSHFRTPAPQKPAPQQPAGAPAPAADVSLPGRLQAVKIVNVTAPVDGEVESVLAETGDEVYEGQVLARIINKGLETTKELAETAVESSRSRVSKLEAAILSGRLEASRARADATRARSEYERLEKTFRRQQMLLREGATPRLAFEKSQKEFSNAEIEFQSLDTLAKQAEDRVQSLNTDLTAAKRVLDDKQKQLEDADAGIQAGEVHAPVDGTVVSRKADAGKVVGPDAESRLLFQIATDLTSMEAVVDADPSFLKRLQPGMPVSIFVADVQQGIEGHVKEVRAGDVVVEFSNPSPLVKPGMPVQVRFSFPSQ